MKPNKDKRSITSKMNGALGGRPKQYEDLYYIDGETWKIIKEFPDYMVSDKGRVLSLINKGRILKQSLSTNGYYKISLSGKMLYTHRLVAQSFIGNIGNKVVDHIDGDKTNNNLYNLRWVTHAENCRASKKQPKWSLSKYRGVCWDNKLNKWKSQITKNKITKNLGTFETEIKAALAWNEKAIELGFANEALNIIEKQNNE